MKLENAGRLIVKYTDGSADVQWVKAPKGKHIARITFDGYWGLEP